MWHEDIYVGCNFVSSPTGYSTVKLFLWDLLNVCDIWLHVKTTTAVLEVFIHASYVGAFENWYSSLNRRDFWLGYLSILVSFLRRFALSIASFIAVLLMPYANRFYNILIRFLKCQIVALDNGHYWYHIYTPVIPCTDECLNLWLYHNREHRYRNFMFKIDYFRFHTIHIYSFHYYSFCLTAIMHLSCI